MADMQSDRFMPRPSRAVLAMAVLALVVPPPTTDREQLTHAALQVRPDVNARRLMVSEAEALYKLEVANRTQAIVCAQGLGLLRA